MTETVNIFRQYRLELDGRCYTFDAVQGLLTTLDDSSDDPDIGGLVHVVCDYGVVPQLREVSSKPRYAHSMLSRELREAGEAMPASAVVVDNQHSLDDRTNLLLYQVVDRATYSRYVRLVDQSTEACLLHSFDRLYVVAARHYRKSAALLLFVHHEVIDLVAVDRGQVVGFRRLTGMVNGKFREERLHHLVDQAKSLQQQVRVPFQQVSVLHFLLPDARPESWCAEMADSLKLPLVESPSAQYALDGEPRRSEILPLLSKLNYRNSSAPIKNRWLAATVALMPIVALGLFFANAAVFSSYALATLDSRKVSAEIASLETMIEEGNQREKVELPPYSTYFTAAEQLKQAQELPGYDELLARLVSVFQDIKALQLDGIRLQYPPLVSREPVRRVAKLVATPAKTVTATLQGVIIADPHAALDIYSKVNTRLKSVGFAVNDSQIETGDLATVFTLTLEVPANEK
jgi:hypothetical protein